MNHRSIKALACCLVATACASYTPGTTPTAFDGEYTGTVTYIHAGANSCPTAGQQPGKLTVEKGSVVWKAPSSDTLYARVMTDGAFQTNENIVFFAGKITKDTMVARSSTGACHTVYDLKRNV